MLLLGNCLDDDPPPLRKRYVGSEFVEAEHLHIQVLLQEAEWLLVQPAFDLLPNSLDFLGMHVNEMV